MTQTDVEVPYDPYSEEMRTDPAAAVAKVREHSPTQWCEALGFWIFSRYDDCRALLGDPRLSFQPDEGDFGSTMSDEQFAALAEDQLEDLMRGAAMLNASFSFMDPPDHTRIRSLVSRAFSSRTIADYRPMIESVATGLLDELDASEPVDIVTQFATPMPITVICTVMGIPWEERATFKVWFDAAEAMMQLGAPADVQAAGLSALVQLVNWAEDLVEERRRNPQDDLLSALVAVEEEGDRLTTAEVVSTVITIFGAGSTTTTRLISNGLIALLRHPDQLDRLRNDPGLWPSAVEELLRFHIPDFRTDVPRTALEDFEFNGHQIRKGQSVRLLVGAASRDPRRFDKPDELDVGRENNKHLIFGRGEHFCLGAPIARLEGEIALHSLVDRFETIELLDDFQANTNALYGLGFPRVPVRLA